MEVLGPVEAPSIEGSNLNVDPVASLMGRRLIFAPFLNPENGNIIIDGKLLSLEVVQHAQIERIEATKIKGDLYAVRLVERGVAFCHTPKNLVLDGCELVSMPDAKQPTHTIRKTKSSCILRLSDAVIGQF